MAANAKVLPRNFVDTFDAEIPKTHSEIPKTIVTFCAIALIVFSLVASYGIDLSAGFF